MAKAKSILLRSVVDVAKRAHNCQHNARHRLKAGERRLKVTVDRSAEHFCTACALEAIERDTARLIQLARQLRGVEALEEEAAD